MGNPRKIIIDTDPGQDDAAAIMLALGSPEELDVLGITTVAGNVPLALTSKNARIVCDFSGKTDVKVYAGCDKPLKRPLVTAEYVHGATGLDGPELHEPVTPLQPEHAVDFIIETLRREPAGTVTLCPLGALTNIATAMIKAPDIVGKIQEIVLMGGAYFEVGNITPAAEFNIYVDPEAAEMVFKSGVPIVMIPLGPDPQGADSEGARRAHPGAGDPCGRGACRDARFLRALRCRQIWLGWWAAARPECHCLPDPARALCRPPMQWSRSSCSRNSPSA